MLHMPTPMLMAGVGGKTYADWVAHIMARTSNVVDQQSTSWNPSPVLWRTTLAAPFGGGGGLIGSSWLDYFGGNGLFPAPRRVVQHGLPSLEAFNALLDKQVIFLLYAGGAQQFYTAKNRNGFTSTGGDMEVTYSCFECHMLGWWDDATQTALMNNPQAGTGPVPYTAPGW